MDLHTDTCCAGANWHVADFTEECKRCHWPNEPQCLLTKMTMQRCCSWQIRCYGLEPNYLIA
eukprot:12062346-Ditylum_brightwellii.AAC.1